MCFTYAPHIRRCSQLASFLDSTFKVTLYRTSLHVFRMSLEGEQPKARVATIIRIEASNTDDSVDEDLITANLDSFSLASPEDGLEDDALHDEALELPQELETTEHKPKGPSKLKAAYENTMHWAGGLISHPIEATKHYTIMRHSHGLVFYHGHLTSVAITIFSDKPLPSDRTLWLQGRGWSGRTGMKLKTLVRANVNWVDVTPSKILDPHRSLPPDNRAWERDIAKFAKKAPKQLRHHKPRETAVIRVPCEAEDGYFRIVLCANGSKKSLCPSPVFRVASSSMSSARFKGASISTLPVEIGVKVLSTMAVSATLNVAGPMVQHAQSMAGPVVQQVQSKVGQYKPSFLTQEVVQTAYNATGVQGMIENANQQYYSSKGAAYERIAHGSQATDSIYAIGSDEGPMSPFPIKFSAKVVKGMGCDNIDTGAPSANLKGVPNDIRAKMTGVYFGWAELLIPSSKKSPTPKTLKDWKPAIITVAPNVKTVASVAPVKEVKVCLLEDFGELKFFEAKMNVMALGYLRPYEGPASKHSSMQLLGRDIAATQLSLSRPSWKIDAVEEQLKLAKKERSLTDHYVNARQYGQKQFDKVPLHMLGVRTGSMGVRDRLVGNGGFSIPRDQG